MSRRKIPIALVIVDTSPLITLARVNRLDVLDLIAAPIKVVDQVHYEATKPENDKDGRIAGWFARSSNSVEIVLTAIGQAARASIARGEAPIRGAGELAVEEYAVQMATTSSPNHFPLVLFEDPDVLGLAIANRYRERVYLLNTTALLNDMGKSGILPDAKAIVAAINGTRKTAMTPIDLAPRPKGRAPYLPLKKAGSDEPT